MKKLLLIFGIVCIFVCVIFLLLAAIHLFGYYHVLDGSAELYRRLHQRMIFSFVMGIIFAVIGTACVIYGRK